MSEMSRSCTLSKVSRKRVIVLKVSRKEVLFGRRVLNRIWVKKCEVDVCMKIVDSAVSKVSRKCG